ncbi:MAG: hypothetical protein ACJ75Z_13980 [Solirubrobacterales bacterium]
MTDDRVLAHLLGIPSWTPRSFALILPGTRPLTHAIETHLSLEDALAAAGAQE